MCDRRRKAYELWATDRRTEGGNVIACKHEMWCTAPDVPEWRTAYKCERYDPGKLPYHNIPGRTEREKTAGSPVRTGRMDRDAYGVRSDDSHGDTLKYLKEKDGESLVNLSSILDDYVRRVFKKVIAVEELNYNDIPEEKAYVRKYFTDLAKMFYSE